MSTGTLVIEFILSPKTQQAVDDLEQIWRMREAEKHWDDSETTLLRIRDWLRSNDNS